MNQGYETHIIRFVNRIRFIQYLYILPLTLCFTLGCGDTESSPDSTQTGGGADTVGGSDIAGSGTAGSSIAGSSIAGSDIAGSGIAGSGIAGSDIAGSEAGFTVGGGDDSGAGMTAGVDAGARAGAMMGGERAGVEIMTGGDSGAEAGTDAGEMNPNLPDTPPPPRDQDSDMDGLEDYWEWSLNAPEHFSYEHQDTDGDGIPDGEEDKDLDGLSAALEFELSQLSARAEINIVSGHAPHPLRRDLVVQIDEMEGCELEPDALLLVIDAFADLARFEIDAVTANAMNEERPNWIDAGVSVHLILDDTLNPRTLNGDFEQRFELLRSSAAFSTAETLEMSAALERALVHVVTANERTDDPRRAGEAVNHPDDVLSAGVIIYTDTIEAQHPSCGIDSPPPVPFVEVYEAQAGTLVHELGHALQLGHDTEIGGGVNPYNVMSVITGCVSTRQRYHGEGNSDPLLGATEMGFAPRFSVEAAALLSLDAKLSVEVSMLIRDGSGSDH